MFVFYFCRWFNPSLFPPITLEHHQIVSRPKHISCRIAIHLPIDTSLSMFYLTSAGLTSPFFCISFCHLTLMPLDCFSGFCLSSSQPGVECPATIPEFPLLYPAPLYRYSHAICWWLPNSYLFPWTLHSYLSTWDSDLAICQASQTWHSLDWAPWSPPTCKCIYLLALASKGSYIHPIP